ncbi:MFS transporter [Trinickia dabaoshanensis]|uniref:MFS transporter n=1 Tax=Trinickia dabaoshanensis TaxID=564714 RepID=A0A2N7VCZ2_9BURK|nr:MFS transporter [Trinickia dabaoshanensis]PMS15032.1 MFS transporter [Trinickia dabaoshanensis]
MTADLSPLALQRRRVLAATSISYFIVILDTSIVNVALERIATALSMQISGLQWVTNAYTLVFAALLLTGGTLGDRVGARNVYLAGLALFTLASTLCALSTTLPMLVGARAVQGIGAAMLVPCSLKLINQASPNPETRARAIGLWVGCGGVAMAAGPVFGGALIHLIGWRSIFFVNVPVGIAGIVLTSRVARDVPVQGARRFDPLGQFAGIVALASLIGVLIEGAPLGWRSPAIVAGALVAIFAWAAFIVIEARSRDAMLPMSLFRSGVFSGSTLVSMGSAIVFYGLLFVASLYYQRVRAYSPLATGLALLPMTAMVAVGGILSNRLSNFKGARASMCIAFGLYAAGALGLLALLSGAPGWAAVAPLISIGLAAGYVTPAATAPALATVEHRHAGVAAGVLNSARQTGSALGVAVFGSVIGSNMPFSAAMRVVLFAAALVALAAALVWWIATAAPKRPVARSRADSSYG